MSAIRAPSEYADEVRTEMSRRLAASGRQNAGILRDQLDRAGYNAFLPPTVCLGAIDCLAPRDEGALAASLSVGFLSLAFGALAGVAAVAETGAVEIAPALWLTLNAADGLFSLAHTTILGAAEEGAWGPERSAAALAALDAASLAASEATGVTLAVNPSGLKDGRLGSNSAPLLEAAARVAGAAAGITGEASLLSLAGWARALGAASVAVPDPSSLPPSISDAIDGISGAGLPRQSKEALLSFAGAVLKEGLS